MKRLMIIVMIAGMFIVSVEGKTIDIEQAKELALQKNVSYLAKKEAYEAAKWNTLSSLSGLLPSGTLAASQSQSKPAGQFFPGSDEFNSQSYGINIEQPLFMGGKKWLDYKMASYSKKMSYLAMLSAKLETIALVEEKYFNVLEAKELMEIIEQQMKSVQINLERAETKFSMGMLSKADLLKFQADVAAKETELILRQTRLNLAKQDLKNTLNFEGDIELQPIQINEMEIQNLSQVPFIKVTEIIQRSIQESLEKNYTLQTLEQSKKIANASVLMAGGNILPSVQLSFGKKWQKYWDENGNASDAGFTDSQQISLSASVPIFPIINNVTGYISARSNQRKTNYESEASKNGIELAVESSVLSLISYAKTVVQADVSLGYSQELYLQMEERFNNGMISSTDLLDAEVMLKNARFSKISAIYSFMKAKSELMNLLSIESQEELYNLIITNK